MRAYIISAIPDVHSNSTKCVIFSMIFQLLKFSIYIFVLHLLLTQCIIKFRFVFFLFFSCFVVSIQSYVTFSRWLIGFFHRMWLRLNCVESLADFLLHPFRKPKRVRTAFSPGQLLKLEHAFESNQYVVGAERKALAQALNLSETQVCKHHYDL